MGKKKVRPLLSLGALACVLMLALPTAAQEQAVQETGTEIVALKMHSYPQPRAPAIYGDRTPL